MLRLHICYVVETRIYVAIFSVLLEHVTNSVKTLQSCSNNTLKLEDYVKTANNLPQHAKI